MRNWNWTPRARFIGELLTAVVVVNYKPATDDARLYVRVNGDSTTNRYYNTNTATGDLGNGGYNDSTWRFVSTTRMKLNSL